MSSEPESKPLYEKNIYMALLAQQCSRYKEMFKYFEDLIKQREKEGKSKDLLPKERELLSYGYITYINSKRNSLHVCMAFETKEKKEYNSAILGPIRDYRKKIEQELSDTINNISLFLDSVLIKNAEDNNTKIYYLKLKGDFNRYITEYEKGIIREKASNTALKAYQDAMNLAKNLYIINRLILGLNLNYSIFEYEVVGERKNAISIAEECVKKIDKEIGRFTMDKNNEDYEIIMDIIDKMKTNLKKWRIEEDEQNKI